MVKLLGTYFIVICRFLASGFGCILLSSQYAARSFISLVTCLIEYLLIRNCPKKDVKNILDVNECGTSAKETTSRHRSPSSSASSMSSTLRVPVAAEPSACDITDMLLGNTSGGWSSIAVQVTLTLRVRASLPKTSCFRVCFHLVPARTGSPILDPIRLVDSKQLRNKALLSISIKAFQTLSGGARTSMWEATPKPFHRRVSRVTKFSLISRCPNEMILLTFVMCAWWSDSCSLEDG